MEVLIDILLLVVVAGVAWVVSGEGAIGAGLTFLSVVLAGLLAMNFFEPLANFLERHVAPAWSSRWDIIALLGLFAVILTLFRLICEQLLPTYVQVEARTHQLGSWGFAFLTGYTTMAILLTALHTAPLPREFIGFKPERDMFFGLAAPDRQWLGFTQYVTERNFGWDQQTQDRDTGETVTLTRMFDGRTAWHWGLPGAGGRRPEEIIMPSFIVRYADRRERLAASAPAAETEPTGGGDGPEVRERRRRSGDDSPSF